ncbi:MAG: glycosyltransferase [Pseudomonadota bacterium]
MSSEKLHFSTSVLTRTRNRDVLLFRAGHSVANQALERVQWVIVNDGGARTGVEEIAGRISSDRVSVKVIHHDEAKGRTAAANTAVANADAPLNILLDDDDTLAPDCLAQLKTACDANPDCVGAVGTSMAVSEKLSEDGSIAEISRSPFYSPTSRLALIDVAYRNPTPLNAVMFRKSVAEKIGGFDERVDLLEDWDFILRLLIEGDICAAPDALSYYHQRPEEDGSMGNSGVASSEDDLVKRRNAYLRQDIAAGRAGLGMITNTRDPLTADRLSKFLAMIGALGGPAKSVKSLFASRRKGNTP